MADEQPGSNRSSLEGELELEADAEVDVEAEVATPPEVVEVVAEATAPAPPAVEDAQETPDLPGPPESEETDQDEAPARISETGAGGGGDEPGEDGGGEATGDEGTAVEDTKIEVVPLGDADSKTLLECDQNPFVLEKLFHEGSMKRLGTDEEAAARLNAEASSAYEDYTWMLEKDFRKVPENMAIGDVRLKPDSLMFEEEKFILGKLDRDLRLSQGYNPTAGKRESVLDFNEAIATGGIKFPAEPKPCPMPVYGDDDTCGGEQGEEAACTRKVMKNGKVFEFQFSGMQTVSVGGDTAGPSNFSSTNSTIAIKAPSPFEDPCDPPPSADDCTSAPISTPMSQKEQGSAGGGGACCGNFTCKNNMACESQIQAICNAARKAMAIYDTVTGCDNFPCNVGDKPDLEMENVEEGVWSWLYTIIYKMVPVEDTDSNQNSTTVPRRPSTAPSGTEAAKSRSNMKRPDDMI